MTGIEVTYKCSTGVLSRKFNINKWPIVGISD